MAQLGLSLGVVALLLGAAALLRRSAVKKSAAQFEALERLVAAGSIAAGVVHEVKNPLVGIVGFAQLGQGSSDLKEMREYFTLIEQDAMRANALLEGMLDFTRPASVAHFEQLEVNSVIEGALRLARHQLEAHGVTVSTELAEGLPAIRGDANQLRQVLVNVLLNAGHAVADAAVKRVTVSTTLDVSHVRVTVLDSGAGLSAEALKNVFIPFFTTKPRGQGTGLGLVVSKQLIEGHGGSLRIENANPGARVTIVLPSVTA